MSHSVSTVFLILCFAILLVLASMFSTLWYIDNLRAPADPPIFIYDIRTLVGRVDPDDPNAQAKLKTLIEEGKRRVEEFKSHGYIVLDGNAVIAAPERFFIPSE